MERRGETVFQWEDQWYSIGREFPEEYVVLPDGTVLSHNGKYHRVVLVSYADYAYGFKEVVVDKTIHIEELARRYNTAIAECIEPQILASLDEENYCGGY